jgi:AcrR family transcriptional regulator
MPTEAGQDADWDNRRADARRNRDRVLAAARDAFAERGLDATVNDVAARAGVGRATVYRIFPAREDLLAAVVAERFQWLEQRSAAALAEPDPVSALESALSDMFRRALADRATLGLLENRAVPGAAQARERTIGNISRLLEAAKRAGAVREDVTVGDLAVLLTGCAERLYAAGVTDPQTWQRYCDFALRAIRP